MFKTRKFFLILFVLIGSGLAFGQASSTGTISASGSTCATTNACISLHMLTSPGLQPSSVGFTVTGSFTGTLQFEQSADGGVTWVGIQAYPQPAGSPVTSTTAAGTWLAPAGGITDVRIRASAFAANSALIVINQTVGAMAIAAGSTGVTTITAYGADPTGVLDSTAAIQAAVNSCGTRGCQLSVPPGIYNIATGPIAYANKGIYWNCLGRNQWGSSEPTDGCVFKTTTANWVMTIGQVGSLSQTGTTINGITFRDGASCTSPGGVFVYNTNNTKLYDVGFEDFCMAQTPAPAAPAIGNAGATPIFVKEACVDASGGLSTVSAEATGNNTTNFTITPSACGANATGQLYFVSTTTGTETLQNPTGNCTLNAAGTACGLGQSYTQTIASISTNLLKPSPYNSTGGHATYISGMYPIFAATQDASYTEFYGVTCRNTTICSHHTVATLHYFGGHYDNTNGGIDILNDGLPFGGQTWVFGSNLEGSNNGIMFAVNATAASYVWAHFEADSSGANGVVCADLASNRNQIGGSFSKCQTGVNIRAGASNNRVDVTDFTSGTTDVADAGQSNELHRTGLYSIWAGHEDFGTTSGPNNSVDTAGTLTCSTNTATLNFATAYAQTPIIVVSDETAAGGARVSAKSASAFTVTCTGASDVVAYHVFGRGAVPK